MMLATVTPVTVTGFAMVTTDTKMLAMVATVTVTGALTIHTDTQNTCHSH